MNILVFGATGQDGRYFVGHALAAGHSVIVCHYYSLTQIIYPHDFSHFKSIFSSVRFLHEELVQLTPMKVADILEKYSINCILNLASVSSIKQTILDPVTCYKVAYKTHLSILEALRILQDTRTAYINAGSIEMYESSVQDIAINSPIFATNPYAASKASNYFNTVAYRSTYNINVGTLVYSNHESYLRDERFLWPKIIKAAISAAQGEKVILKLGDLTIARDWGLAYDFMLFTLHRLSSSIQSDYIVATGRTTTIENLVALIFSYFNLDYKMYLTSDPTLFRSNENRCRRILKSQLCLEEQVLITDSLTRIVDKVVSDTLKHAE